MVNGIFAAQIEYGGRSRERERDIERVKYRKREREREWAESTVSRLICVKHKTHTKVVKRNMLKESVRQTILKCERN